jgi:cation:H+ antiporter
MQIVDFAAPATPVNIAIFTGAATVVWFAGIKLTAYAKIICDRTGADQAFIGILLLGAVVSLPEMATTIAAAVLGDARLAVNILLGGIAAAMVILALTDALTGDEPLSTDISHPIVLLQGILVVLFLTLAASGIVVGDAPLNGVGMWTSALLAFYVLFILLAKRYGARETWMARDGSTAHAGRLESARTRGRGSERSIAQISFLVTLAAAAILGSGFHQRLDRVLARLSGLIPTRLARLERATFERFHHGIRGIGIVCHDVATGQPCYFSTEDHRGARVSDVVRASASTPSCFLPSRSIGRECKLSW